MENIKWVVLGIAILMYILVIAFQEKKVWFTTIAAILVVILGIIFPSYIFDITGKAEDLLAGSSFNLHIYSITHSLFDLINWNVLMIYVGSMIIASLFIYSKVPVRIADTIVLKSKSTGFAIVAILAMTGIISIFVENVATLLVMAPIALALSKKLKINPTMFLIGLAVMSNLEGTATLVGDPPSMIFASFAGYSFNDFFFHNGHISIFFIIQSGMLAGCVFFYFLFARKSKDKIEVEKEPVISWMPSILLLTMIFGLAIISFIKTDFEYLSGLFVFALGIIGVIWFKLNQKKSKDEVKTLLKELDWETIFFLMGIFVVVGSIQETGLLDMFAGFLAKLAGNSVFLGFLLVIFVSVVISGFIDNVPYILAMLPVANAMAIQMNIAPELYMFALLIGSCLGGNLTPYGASANVVSSGILKKEGYPLSFGGWLKVGIPFTIITTTVAAGFLWLFWRIF